MKTITTRWCMLILGFILSINVYAQDTLTVINATSSIGCDGSAIVNRSIVGQSWTWHNADGSQVIQQGGDTLYNLCIGDYMMKFFVPALNDTKSVRFHIGMSQTNPCANTNLIISPGEMPNNGTAPNCGGGMDVTVTGGQAPYMFALNSGSLSSMNVFNGLCANVYALKVIDAAGCEKVISVTINNGGNNGGGTNGGGTNANCANSTLNGSFSKIMPNTSTDPVNCNGSFEIFATGGNAPYEFSLDTLNFTPNNVFAGLCTKVYYVHVKDSLGCRKVMPVAIVDGNNNGGGNNGGGTNGGGTNANCANSTLNGSFSKIMPNTSTDPVNCNGSFEIFATGGNAPYQFSLDTLNFTPNNMFAGLCTKVYNVHIKDSLGCHKVMPVAIVDGNNNGGGNNGGGNNGGPVNNGKLCQAEMKVNPIDATGLKFHFRDSSRVDSLGTVTSYEWKSDNIIIGTTAEFVHLFTTGHHTVSLTINTSNGCTDTKIDSAYFPMFDDVCHGVIIKIAVTPPTAASTCSGILKASVSGVTNYTYNWSNNLGSTSLTQDSLCPGTYTITVTANGCTKSESRIIFANTLPSVNCATSTLNAIISSVVPSSISGSCTGEVSINAQGGVLPYHFTLKNPSNTANLLTSLDPHFTNLCKGGYIATVVDSVGCSRTFPVSIQSDTTRPNGCANSTLKVTAAVTANTNLASAGCNGSVNVTATGGVGTILYSFDNGLTFVYGKFVDSLCPNAYQVKVQDSLGCISHVGFTIVSNTGTNPCIGNPLKVELRPTNVSVVGACNGSIEATVSGATNYTYSWSNNLGTSDLRQTNLCKGSYFLTVTSNGCTKTQQMNVGVDVVVPNVCANSTLAATTTTMRTFNATTCNGKITVAVTGGQAPFKFSRDKGVTLTDQPVFMNLCADTFNIMVKDNQGCIKNVTGIVRADSVKVTQNPCNGSTLNGKVSAMVPTQATDCSGKFYVNAFGGKAPYHFNLVNTETGNSFTSNAPFFDSLCAGNYAVTIVDSVGCIRSFPLDVHTDTLANADPCRGSALAITFVSTNSTMMAANACNGGLVATVSGAANYTYLWSNNLGSTSLAKTNLCPGMYKLTVTANGCSKTEVGYVNVGVVSDPCTGSTLNGAITYSVPTTPGNSVGKLGVYATGGAIPYTFIAKNTYATGVPVTLTTPQFTNLSEGHYSIIIRDSLGCTKYLLGRVEVKAVVPNAPVNPCIAHPVTISVEETNVSAAGTCDGGLVTTVTADTTYTYTWSNNLGSTSLSQSALCPGLYRIKVRNGHGCVVETVGKVGINTPTNPCVNSTLSATITTTNVMTAAGCDGTASAVVMGGVAPFTYRWNTAATTSFIDTLCHDTYKVYVKDAQGCFAVATGKVVRFSAPNAPAIPLKGYVIPVGESTANGCDGSANTLVYGGTAPYTFMYSNNSTEACTPYLCGGFQTVTVKDAVGDSLVLDFIITSPEDTKHGTVIVHDSLLVDSLYSEVVTNCVITDFNSIDSVSILNYTFAGVDSILVNWMVFYNGTSLAIVNKYAIDSTVGVYQFALQLFCNTKTSGQFLTAYDQVQITAATTGGGSAGIKEVNNNTVGIYPNPFRDHIIISLDNDNSSEVVVTDIAGKEVVNRTFNTQMIKVDMSTLSSGSYIVTVRNNNTVTTRQIVK